jgi:phosphoribosylglycinamide formyltransferase-1
MKIGFLASNNGSSLRAIVAASQNGTLAAEPRIVISNRPDAPALEFARAKGLATAVIQTLPDPEAADELLAKTLSAADVDLVVLSGYLRRLGPRTLKRFAGRVLNIHPALLPRHGGQGMYGRRVHQAVLDAGETVTGASVHIVDDEYDHGAVLAQVEVKVHHGDDAKSLEARVMAVEPGLFIDTLQRIVAGDLPLPAG